MDKYIDTRDLHDRYNELRDKIEEAKEAWADSETDDPKPEPSDVLDTHELADWNDLDFMEVNIPDFWFGETIIHEDYFTEYAEELAEDLGYTGRNVEGQTWPFNHIDWEAAAEELKVDYFEVEWQGETYLAR